MGYSAVLRIPQYFRNLHRLGEILAVLVRHGFGDLVHRIGLSRYVPTRVQQLVPWLSGAQAPELTLDKRLRRVCEELGTTFIKFGQLVASRPDIFGSSIAESLRSLQDQAPPFPVEIVRQVITEELHRPPDDIFASFSEQPLAAGSVAQVHRATLKSGEAVVVKVQRPNIGRMVEADLEILLGLAALIHQNIPESRVFRLTAIVEEFSRHMRAELDFRREATNTRKFANNFAALPNLVVPRVYQDCSSGRVLVEDFILGVKADDREALQRLAIDGRQVVETLSTVLLQSIFEHRFFHADPHPGNILVTAEGRVALIDFGIMGRLDKARIEQVLQFLMAILSHDLERMVRVLREHALAPLPVDASAFKTEVAQVLDQYLGQPLGRLRFSALVREMVELVRRYHIELPADLFLVGKSVVALEDVAARLAPDYDPVAAMHPTLMRMYTASITDPRMYAALLSSAVESYRKLASDLPDQLRHILRELTQGNFTINSTIGNFDDIRRHQNRIVNRILAGVIGTLVTVLGLLLLVADPVTIGHTPGYLLLSIGLILLFCTWRAIARNDGL